MTNPNQSVWGTCARTCMRARVCVCVCVGGTYQCLYPDSAAGGMDTSVSCYHHVLSTWLNVTEIPIFCHTPILTRKPTLCKISFKYSFIIRLKWLDRNTEIILLSFSSVFNTQFSVWSSFPFIKILKYSSVNESTINEPKCKSAGSAFLTMVTCSETQPVLGGTARACGVSSMATPGGPTTADISARCFCGSRKDVCLSGWVHQECLGPVVLRVPQPGSSWRGQLTGIRAEASSASPTISQWTGTGRVRPGYREG